ncbi:MAG: Rieske (2Fe-2S) protein [Candidatus Binatia bacterium]
MSSSMPVSRADELAPGQTRKFVLQRDGRELEAFVLNHAGRFVAYVNQCCHIPMAMDWVENQFLTEDGTYILCATHGALYQPDDGQCVDGPPLGKCLTAVPIEVRDGVIFASWPDGAA